MAQPAFVRRFDVEVADSDRSVFASLELRVGQHPSETDRYLVARVLARCLEHTESLTFTRGLAVDDEPALWEKDPTGRLLTWIEVGMPSADRLHRAQKSGARVAVYCHGRVEDLVRDLEKATIHRADELEIIALEPAFLDRITKTLDRNNTWQLTVSGGALYLTIGKELFEASPRRIQLTQG